MQCELCDRFFEKRAGLASHMRFAHGARLPGSPADLDDLPEPFIHEGVALEAPEPFTDAAATYEGTNTAWMVARLDSPRPVSSQPDAVEIDAAQQTRIRNLRRSGVSFPEAYESVMGVVPPPEVIATYTAPAVNRLDGMAERVRGGRASTPDVLYLYRLALIGRDAITLLGAAFKEQDALGGYTPSDWAAQQEAIIDRWEAADQ